MHDRGSGPGRLVVEPNTNQFCRLACIVCKVLRHIRQVKESNDALAWPILRDKPTLRTSTAGYADKGENASK